MIFNWFKKKYRKSPTEIIEEDKEPWKEQYFIKKLGKELKECAYIREAKSVIKNDEKVGDYFKKTGEKPLTELHTHPTKRGESDGANASTVDIVHFLREKNIKTSIIAQQNPKTGKVEGYTLMRKTEKTPKFDYSAYEESSIENLIEKSEEIYKKAYILTHESLPKELQRHLLGKAASKFNFKYRRVPVRGYKLDRNLMSFAPIEKKNLETKLAVIIGLTFLISILFMSSGITGLVVGKFASKTPTIGAGLFILGIVLFYFYFKKK